MKRIAGAMDGNRQHQFHAVAVIITVMVILTSSCTKPPDPLITTGQQPVPIRKNEKVLGTWVSEQWPDQKYIFNEDKVVYQELMYSVLLEESATYTLDSKGNVAWTIVWHSGNSTHWRGVLDGDRMTVEFVNSWDDSRGTDTLNRVDL